MYPFHIFHDFISWKPEKKKKKQIIEFSVCGYGLAQWR